MIENTNTGLTEDAEKIFRTQAWQYFSLHSAQRMQSFQFYITLVTALIGGAIVLLKSDNASRMWLALVFAIASLQSFVFWKLDCRTRQLIKNAEAAMKYLDYQYNLPDVDALPHPLRLFDKDDVMTGRSYAGSILTGKLSYSRCFNVVFAVFGYGSAVLAIKFVLFG